MRKCSKSGCKEKRVSYEYLNKWNRGLAGRYSALKRAVNDLGLSFDITREEHAKLLSRRCEYCTGPLSPTGSGIDRKDNSKGYVIENAVPCCVVCNRIKNRYLTYEEMKAAMRAVLRVRAYGS